MKQLKSNDRTARWLTLTAEPSTFEAICTAQAIGRGAVAWCKERDVRYMDVMRWIESDPSRAFGYDLATKARGAQTVAQLEGVTRMAIAGAVDPRAAAVASKNLQWLAGVYDRKKFGEQTRVDHRHTFSADHLATLKQLGGADGSQHAPQGSPTQVRVTREAPVALDAEFRELTPIGAEARDAMRQVLDEADAFGV